jgi:hypothetical protein
MIPPSFPAVILAELLFGVGYNWLVAVMQKKDIWHVSFSVVIGVAATLLIELAFWWNLSMPFWNAILCTFACFAASGLPMVTGSQLRTVELKKNHKRHEWPTAARRARDLALEEISLLINDISVKAKEKTICMQDLPDFVNRLYQVIGILKSVK